jgi:hypothetical protein
LKTKIWPHWHSLAYICAIPLTLAYLEEKKKSISLFIVSISIFLLLVISVLLFISPGIIFHQNEYAQNSNISLPKGIKAYAQTGGAAAILEFYSKQPIYLANGFLRVAPVIWGEKQYEIWGNPELVKGESAIFFGNDSESNIKILSGKFAKVTVLETKLFLSESYMNTYKTFLLEGYKLSGSHP